TMVESDATRPATPGLTAFILAGGRGSRMGGRDKGLLTFKGRPLIEHVLHALAPQVDGIVINANRYLDSYAAFGYPVVADTRPGRFGPLAGFITAMELSPTHRFVIVPCDGPYLPPDLVQGLQQAAGESPSGIAMAHDGNHAQPVYALLHRGLMPSLEHCLEAGHGKALRWLRDEGAAVAHFPGTVFRNINTPNDLLTATPDTTARRQRSP
ncbi:MAG: molybdenum cofactor guanylyltransferase MobA, partial [Gammaproteobacteria bacterium]